MDHSMLKSARRFFNEHTYPNQWRIQNRSKEGMWLDLDIQIVGLQCLWNQYTIIHLICCAKGCIESRTLRRVHLLWIGYDRGHRNSGTDPLRFLKWLFQLFSEAKTFQLRCILYIYLEFNNFANKYWTSTTIVTFLFI